MVKITQHSQLVVCFIRQSGEQGGKDDEWMTCLKDKMRRHVGVALLTSPSSLPDQFAGPVRRRVN